MKHDPGPLCVCGCYASEHESTVSHGWEWVAGACLTCRCEGFRKAEHDDLAQEAHRIARGGG